MKRWIKNVSKVAILVSLTTLAWAQEGSEGSKKSPLERKLAKKMKSEFLMKGSWYTDFDEAKKASKEQGKPIVAYFSRSYAP